MALGTDSLWALILCVPLMSKHVQRLATSPLALVPIRPHEGQNTLTIKALGIIQVRTAFQETV